MFDTLLLVDAGTTLGRFVHHSLEAEGYHVVTVAHPKQAVERLVDVEPSLVLLHAAGQVEDGLDLARDVAWSAPVLVLAGTPPPHLPGDWQFLETPCAFQDLLVLIQDLLYQRTLADQRPLQLSAALLDRIEGVLTGLRDDLHARCVVLSSSGGRLIRTVGSVDQGVAIALAALMSAGFSATARAAQMLGQGDAFDSSLQESEGYGLYAIRLHDRLILSVAFSDQITVGMVRHYAAQAVVDILEILIHGTEMDENMGDLNLDTAFRQTVSQALGDMLGE
jgi:predicted regulator of Ras-like GTPase activity (Roadblock/LC7/MglB family)